MIPCLSLGICIVDEADTIGPVFGHNSLASAVV